MQTITKLQDAISELVEVCRQAQQGYASAASAVREPLHAELMQYSRQRAEFLAELLDMLQNTGLSAGHGDSALGHAHHAWKHWAQTPSRSSKDQPDAPSDPDTRSVLKDCESGDQDAIQAYRHTLESPLPSAIGELISAQYQAIKRVQERLVSLIRSLERSAAPRQQ